MFTNFRERGKKGEREKHRCDRETGRLPPGSTHTDIESVTLRRTEWCSNQLSQPAKIYFTRFEESKYLPIQGGTWKKQGIIKIH